MQIIKSGRRRERENKKENICVAFQVARTQGRKSAVRLVRHNWCKLQLDCTLPPGLVGLLVKAGCERKRSGAVTAVALLLLVVCLSPVFRLPKTWQPLAQAPHSQRGSQAIAHQPQMSWLHSAPGPTPSARLFGASGANWNSSFSPTPESIQGPAACSFVGCALSHQLRSITSKISHPVSWSLDCNDVIPKTSSCISSRASRVLAALLELG
jgi:hypothetical protein